MNSNLEILDNILVSAGISENQILVYKILLDHGGLIGKSITEKCGLKKGLTYKILEQLEELGLVEKLDSRLRGNEGGKGPALFLPKHPSRLGELVHSKSNDLMQSERVFEEILPSLVSKYNLLSGKPYIAHFEGEAQLSKMLDHSLELGGPIYTYASLELVQKYMKEINERHITQRTRLGIKKKIILIDTPAAREYAKNQPTGTEALTEIRLIKKPPFEIGCVTEIYPESISFLTLTSIGLVGSLVSNREIYLLQRHLFEIAWEGAEVVN